MREIKFRAWDKSNKEMIVPDFIESDGTVGEYLIGEEPYKYPEERITLMQYTGLKDKNGKEIYEGDIVSSSWGYNGEVEYDEFIYAKCEHTIDEDIEVIGNIWENPELLDK